MTQLNFIDNPPLARTTDHATSQASAAETAGKLYLTQQRFLEAAGQIQGDFTASEVGALAASMFGCNAETVRKRCLEIERQGLIREHAIRACGVTGKPARSFVLNRQ